MQFNDLRIIQTLKEDLSYTLDTGNLSTVTVL